MKSSRLITLCVASLLPLLAFADVGSEPTAKETTAQEIVARLVENNQRRHDALKEYTSQRNYHLVYTGFPGRREADMVVDMKFESPDHKEFEVTSESGSGLILNRVFRRLLESEKEAADERNQKKTALTPDNYDFQLLGQESVNGRSSYVLKVNPKADNKFLYQGTVWVDAADFAVAKIEAQPAKNPSFWIKKTQIRHTYQKFDDFWLPVENQSTTDVKLGGHATLIIRYSGYKVVPRPDLQPASVALPAALPKRSSLDVMMVRP
jgi:outer membrane lipoprotein-sorting protein